MAIEIERKFLVTGDAWRVECPDYFCQGYLTTDPERTVRVRETATQGFITIKGKSAGASRMEFEYPIPKADAHELLALCEPPLIEKYRHVSTYEGLIWEVDEFLGSNAGLVVAEVELSSEGQYVALPEWVGVEVTGDVRYYNAQLIKNPYPRWNS